MCLEDRKPWGLDEHERMRKSTHANRLPAPATRSNSGAVLLEVVLALVLFVVAAAIVGSGINASVNSVERLKAQTHASDLAVTVLSEIQLGTRPAASLGPEPFAEPFTNWTCQTTVTLLGDGTSANSTAQVEIAIRKLDSPLVHRLSQIVPLPAITLEAP